MGIINTHYKRDILKYVCQILPQVEHPKLPDRDLKETVFHQLGSSFMQTTKKDHVVPLHQPRHGLRSQASTADFPQASLDKKKTWEKTQESASISVNDPNIFPTSYIQRRAAPAATDGATALLGPWRAIVAWLQAKFARSTVLISAYGRGLELGLLLAMHI